MIRLSLLTLLLFSLTPGAYSMSCEPAPRSGYHLRDLGAFTCPAKTVKVIKKEAPSENRKNSEKRLARRVMQAFLLEIGYKPVASRPEDPYWTNTLFINEGSNRVIFCDSFFGDPEGGIGSAVKSREDVILQIRKEYPSLDPSIEKRILSNDSHGFVVLYSTLYEKRDGSYSLVIHAAADNEYLLPSEKFLQRSLASTPKAPGRKRRAEGRKRGATEEPAPASPKRPRGFGRDDDETLS